MTHKGSFLLACVAVLSIWPKSVDAADYQVQVGGDYERINPDSNNQPDVHTWSAFGTYYLAPVPTRSHPLAEAAFLERVSSITARYGQIDNGPGDTEILSFAGNFYLKRVLLGGQMTRISNGGNETYWSATIGHAPVDGALITVAYSDFDEGVWSISGKLVRPIDVGRALGLQAGVSFFEHMNEQSMNFDYYPDRSLTLGGGITISEWDRGGSDTKYTAVARKFFTPAISVGVHYTVGDSYDAFGINGSIRF